MIYYITACFLEEHKDYNDTVIYFGHTPSYTLVCINALS